MSRASKAEVREILAQLKAIIVETLEVLSDREKLSRNDSTRAKANKQDRA